MVIVSINATNEHNGDMRASDRILRGIEGMRESGYIVERYDHYNPEPDKAKKIILAVARTDEADDKDFEGWLRSLLFIGASKPIGSGQI